VARITQKVRKMIRVARREWSARVGLERDRERGRERDRPPHAGPPDQQRLLPGGRRIALAHPADQPARQIGEREHPHEPDRDHGRRHERAVADQGRGRVSAERVEQALELEAEEHEQQSVQQEHENLPDRQQLEPGGRRGDEPGGPPAEVDAGGDGGEHA
jgi:hypothetical protein